MRKLVALSLCWCACGPAAPPHRTASPQGGGQLSRQLPIPAPDPALEARRHFQNPGGMWTPSQMPAHVITLRELGMKLDPQALSDPMAFPLGAVVYLGGCSASFVSPDGLIITNHHCATGALQFNSTPEHNLLHDGYLAKTRADEKRNGPAARVYVTELFTDVSDKVRAGLEEIREPKARYDALEKRQKEIVAECEKGRPQIRCSVASFFGGEQFTLVEQLELRDVRLVYAPAEGIGNFGGEIDNWRWPRHAGDYSFFRAYVGADGKPADFDPKNVPYQPRYHLKIADKPLSPHDLVMVMGYPARTNRLKTAAEAAEAVDWYYPRLIKLCEDYSALLDQLGKQDPALAIKGRSLLRGLDNTLTNARGQLEELVQGGLKNKKTELEQQLRKWLGEHPERAAAAHAIDAIAEKLAHYHADRDQEAATEEAVRFSALLGAADLIVHMAIERPKPDAERDPSLQDRNHPRIIASQEQLQQSYARKLDREKLKLALTRAAALPPDTRPKLLSLVVPGAVKQYASYKGKQSFSAFIGRDLDAALSAMYDKTKLEDEKTRIELFQKATVEELKKSDDPFIKLAIALRPILQDFDDKDKAYVGDTLFDRIQYVAALRAKQGGLLAPDANSTLRITYGTVRGYKPKPDSPEYFPFTTLSGMLAKNTGKPPFAAPPALIEAATQLVGEAKNSARASASVAPYMDAALGEVPIDFLSDLDITGGNSGSPTINADGELCGLAFDGNYESMASDWLFMPDITRAIHVDIRYVLWLMDRVDKAHALLREMGVTPSSD